MFLFAIYTTDSICPFPKLSDAFLTFNIQPKLYVLMCCALKTCRSAREYHAQRLNIEGHEHWTPVYLSVFLCLSDTHVPHWTEINRVSLAYLFWNRKFCCEMTQKYSNKSPTTEMLKILKSAEKNFKTVKSRTLSYVTA